MNRFRTITATLALIACCGGNAHAAPPAYSIASHIALPQAGKITALAIDAAHRRIFVAGADGIEAIDADSGAAIGTVAIKGGAGGIVLADDLGRGFASESAGKGVTIFDLASLRTIANLPLGGAPAALAYDAGTQRVFVADEGEPAIAAIDAAKGTLIGKARLPGKPGALALNSYGSLFASMPGTDRVAVVGTSNVDYLGAIPVPQGEDCSGLALDPVGRRLFVGCANGALAVIDTDDDFAFEQLAGAKGASAATFVSRPDGKDGWKGTAVFTHGDGTISLVRMDAFIRYSLGGEIKLQQGLGPIAFDPKTHRFVVAANTATGGAELLFLAH